MSWIIRWALIALVGSGMFPAGIGASEHDEERVGGKSQEEIVTMTSEGEHVSLFVEEGPRIRVVSEGEDDEIIEIDLSDVGDVIRDAMASVHEALEGIEEMQIDMKLGRENSLTVFDGEDEVIIDVAQIMDEVGEALREAFEELEEEFDDAGDEHRIHRHRNVESEFNAREEEQLRRQLRELKDEISDLKAELRRLERRQRH